ncbi:MAG: hypothetical protein J6Y34_02680 [Bacteroidales bacterium]|nr:hypothetical protein [Bacteroidales bacterium]
MRLFGVVAWIAGCFCCGVSMAQQASPIRCTADLLQYDNGLFPGAQVFTGNVEFRHEGSVGYADTVFYYEKANMLEAFGGEVIIHINDSVHLSGHSLRYDGASRTAVLDGNVVLYDNHSTLYTDLLTFYRAEQYAFYDCGGRIENDSAVLTSRCGYYYTSTSDAYFRQEVRIRHPEFTLDADTLRYNTREERAFFLGPTRMHSDSNSVYCENGWYAVKTGKAAFFGPTEIYSRHTFLTADTLYYDHLNDAGEARSHVFVQDTATKHFLQGGFLEYTRGEGYAYITDSALAVYIQEGDSLFLHADTLWADLDSNRHITAVSAYSHVRFFHRLYQGRCGQLCYYAADSVVEMLDAPLMWNDSNQLLADTCRFFLSNGELREAHLLKNAFMSQNVSEELHFNQIKGESMYVFFKENQPEHMWVYPDAVCLYYILDNDSALIGVHQASAEKMKVLFDSSELTGIVFYRKIKGEFGPEGQGEARFLPGFIWLGAYRPQNRESLFLPDHYVPARPKSGTEDEEDE